MKNILKIIFPIQTTCTTTEFMCYMALFHIIVVRNEPQRVRLNISNVDLILLHLRDILFG